MSSPHMYSLIMFSLYCPWRSWLAPMTWFLMMSIKDMAFEKHPAVHFTVLPHQSLNKLHIVFSFVISHERPEPLQQSFFQAAFSFLVSFLGNSFLPWILWSDEEDSFDFCHLTQTNCFIKPSLMCSIGICTFWVPPTWHCSSPQPAQSTVTTFGSAPWFL